jgi:hypothetical protein
VALCLCGFVFDIILTVSTPEKDNFNVDLTFSGRDNTYVKPVAAVIALIGIAFIVATMTTDVAAYLLPMDDAYLQILVPVAADGAGPLSLRALSQEIKDKTIVVNGSVANRTDYPVSNIVAVVEMQDTTGRFPQTIEAPVDPVELAPQAAGNFTAMATLEGKPAGYLVKFRLLDGPFVPHIDERAPALDIKVVPAPPK